MYYEVLNTNPEIRACVGTKVLGFEKNDAVPVDPSTGKKAQAKYFVQMTSMQSDDPISTTVYLKGPFKVRKDQLSKVSFFVRRRDVKDNGTKVECYWDPRGEHAVSKLMIDAKSDDWVRVQHIFEAKHNEIDHILIVFNEGIWEFCDAKMEPADASDKTGVVGKPDQKPTEKEGQK